MWPQRSLTGLIKRSKQMLHLNVDSSIRFSVLAAKMIFGSCNRSISKIFCSSAPSIIGWFSSTLSWIRSDALFKYHWIIWFLNAFDTFSNLIFASFGFRVETWISQLLTVATGGRRPVLKILRWDLSFSPTQLGLGPECISARRMIYWANLSKIKTESF